MWGRGIAPVPTSYLPELFRLGPVPHTGHLPRAIKLHRQNTSLDQGVASWDGAMPYCSEIRLLRNPSGIKTSALGLLSYFPYSNRTTVIS